MRLCLFDDYRLGVVEGDAVYDVTGALDAHDTGFATPFWVRLCREHETVLPRIEKLRTRAEPKPLTAVTLRAPVLNPSKIVAAASNYGDHVQEMAPRVPDGWMLDFDIFLKAPSALAGPSSTVALPPVGDREVHHEIELAVVIGKEAAHIDEAEAMDYVLGYTGLIDLTVRGSGDRSRRKSYNGFAPVGPWLVTSDEVPNPHDVDLRLWVNEELRQAASTSHLLVSIPAMLAHTSRIMTLLPGDVFATGTPAGVGPVKPADRVVGEVGGIGRLEVNIT
ncbi:MAG: FAA hydrolase family protein [Nitriliruptorales bacterium]|nr:FAA hydrolase family protein [Nitriliruptorales bacterium]